MFEVIFLISVILYFILSFIFLNSAGKNFKKIKHSELPSVTVIVAARNEENNILGCMESLDKIDYPEDKLEIIIVDDQSEDSTGEIIDDFTAGKRKFKKLSSPPVRRGLKGKTNALACAIESAAGSIIITTDADCTVAPDWVQRTVSYYGNDTGAVCGFTKIKIFDWFSGLQALDLSYLLTIAAGTINIKRPISCIGNNMSFLKKAYLDVGGYENLPFSVTEDFLLINAIHKTGKYKIIFPVKERDAVETKPCGNLRELFRQKKRWAAGGMNASAWGMFVMMASLLTNYCLILTPLFFSQVCLYLAVFKIAIDFFLLYPVHKQLGISNDLKYFLHFQIYYTLYIIILPWTLLFSRKVRWKGREY